MSDPVDISKMAGAAGEWGETAKILVSALDRVCTPVAEEAALILRDKLHAYRVRNLVAMAKKLQPLLEDVPAGDQAPPRLAAAVMEHASWTADDQIQGMWAGLLASSCSPGARDDGNLIFIDLLSRLTAPQVRILDVVCRDVPKRAQGGLIGVQSAYLLDREQIMSISGLDDLARVDRELDHLRSIGLLDDESGFPFGTNLPPRAALMARVTPTGLALQLYVRCKGSLADPVRFFGLTEPAAATAKPPPEPCAE